MCLSPALVFLVLALALALALVWVGAPAGCERVLSVAADGGGGRVVASPVVVARFFPSGRPAHPGDKTPARPTAQTRHDNDTDQAGPGATDAVGCGLAAGPVAVWR